MIQHRKMSQTIVAILIFTLLITTFTIGSAPVSAAEVPSGNFNPKTAMLKQGEYDPDTYYVFYNGNINTKMVDPGNKALDDEGEFDKATVIVTLDQKIKYLDDSDASQTLDQWIAAEESAEGVEIGSAGDEGADAVWINLKKETVIPGLHDSHIHYESGGGRRYAADIFWKPLAEIKIIIKNEVAKTVPGTRISASGWNQTLDTWNGGNTDFPTKEDLDEVSPDNFVVLGRTDGHANWANSYAMRRSPYGGAKVENGVLIPGPADEKNWPVNKKGDPMYADPPGGVIIRDAKTGFATGIFVDGAMGTVNEYTDYLPSATANADPDRNALSANDYLLSYGLTSFMEAGTGESSVKRYLQLQNAGKMKVRGYILIRNGNNNGEDTGADVAFRNSTDPFINQYQTTNTAVKGAILPEDTNYKLTVKGTKTSLDGALGSRGARLHAPYSDAGADGTAPDYQGAEERFTDELVYDFLKRNYDAGWNISFHAIGDVATDQNLDAIEKYLIEEKGLVKNTNGYFNKNQVEALGLRPRSEHFQITSKGAIERAASMNLTPSMQFVHATSDMSMAGDRVGEKRLQWSYAWRKAIKSGMVIANGTDWAVDLLNPYHGLSAGVTRMDRDGKAPKSPRGVGVPWNPITTSESKASDERVTRAEALHYYTWGGAYGEFAEDLKGSLEVGKLADFAVIDRDYFDENVTKDSDIKDINALMTVVGGEICYAMEKPEIITDEIGDARVGAPYAFTVTGDTDHSPTFNWSITDRDPALKWLAIDYHSGALSGKPTKAGTFEFDVTAKNYLGANTMTLRLTVYDNQNIGSAVVTPVKNQIYNGKAKTPALTVKMGSKVLKAGTDYTVAYAKNTAIGKATATITGKGDYIDKKVATFKIVPKAASVKSITSGKQKVTVKWGKVSGPSNYQISYKVKGAKTWKTKAVSASKSSLTIKSLKKGKYYQVKVRSYKTVDKVKYYSDWSKVKTSKKVK